LDDRHGGTLDEPAVERSSPMYGSLRLVDLFKPK